MNSNTIKEITDRAVAIYTNLRNSGFEEPQALTLTSGYINNVLYQEWLRNESDFKTILLGEKKLQGENIGV